VGSVHSTSSKGSDVPADDAGGAGLAFRGTLFHWAGPAPWYFVAVPAEHCEFLKAASPMVSYGWGMVPVTAHIGATSWRTSLWPKDGGYLVPVKVSVRKAERLAEGQTVTLRLEVGP
jgi:hypothetical protein